jgi:hypothetical protein
VVALGKKYSINGLGLFIIYLFIYTDGGTLKKLFFDR